MQTSTPPPRRLSEATHRLAQRALSGEYARAMSDLVGVSVPDNLSPDLQYALWICYIAEHAPIRLIDGELIVGSATLREAMLHLTPGLATPSTSHTTLGFDRVLKIGYAGIRKEICERLQDATLTPRQQDFLNAMLLCLQAATTWHRRTMHALADDSTVANNLCNVPEYPPQTFAEAVQALWFAFAFQRLCGTWSGVGRIDQMLGEFLRRDLEQNVITIDEARELLAHFWIKGAEWAGATEAFGCSGDSQFYQNIVLGPVTDDPQSGANLVTQLVLEIVEELLIGDFPVAVRCNAQTPPDTYRRIAQTQKRGGGIVAIYNEEVVIDGLIKLGIPPADAQHFANDGCWEAIIPGQTCFGYIPYDMVQMLQDVLGLNTDAATVDYADFEQLYAAFIERIAERVHWHRDFAATWNIDGPPTPLVSMLIGGCIERARGYYERGSNYSVLALHAGGLANAADSLSVLKKIVFDDRRFSLREFVEILRDNFQNHETLRREILSKFEFYGNDNDPADAMVTRVFDDFTAIAAQTKCINGVYVPAGLSTFGREIAWRYNEQETTGRIATADGHHCGEFLATNFSPTPGAERKGPTATINSYCKQDFTKTPNGATLEIKLHPQTVEDDAGTDILAALLQTFIAQRGWFMQLDVVDTQTLRDAQLHPEKYPNLPVRISGWSARFVTLGKEWQDMIINRTQQQ